MAWSLMSAEIDKKMQGSVSRPIRSFFSATMPLTGFEISVGGVLSIPVVAGLTFIGFKSWGEKTLDSSKLKPKKPAPATTAVAKKATPAKKSGPAEQTSATVKTTITEKTTDTDNKPATDKTTATDESAASSKKAAADSDQSAAQVKSSPKEKPAATSDMPAKPSQEA